MKAFLSQILYFIIYRSFRLWQKLNSRSFSPRLWSNDELKKVSSQFRGKILNVSAGKDSDKEGGYYKNYFTNADSYTVTNYTPVFQDSAEYDEIQLDLEQDIPTAMQEPYDIVFNHTVLEHIFDTQKAVENLCLLSKDIVVTVVPWMQAYHHEEEYYKDWWRISPFSLVRLFNNNGFKTICIDWNTDPLGSIYIFHIASKQASKWQGKIKLKLNSFSPGFHRHKIGTAAKGKYNKIQTLQNLIDTI